MLQRIDPTRTRSWQKLLDHSDQMKPIPMKTLFAQGPERFSRFSLRFGDILVDFSKIGSRKKALTCCLSWPRKPS